MLTERSRKQQEERPYGALFASYAYIIVSFDASSRLLGNTVHHFTNHEAARVEPQGDAELQELIDPHFTLPVEHIPQPFLVNADASGQLSNTNSPHLPHFVEDPSLGGSQSSLRLLLSHAITALLPMAAIPRTAHHYKDERAPTATRPIPKTTFTAEALPSAFSPGFGGDIGTPSPLLSFLHASFTSSIIGLPS